jgi:Fe-S cluster assembly protein SufD
MHNTLLNLYAEHEADLARESGDAVASKRRAAIDRFEALGFPTKQWESWKYTSLKTTLATEYTTVPPFASASQHALEFKDLESYFLDELDAYRVVFVNGVYSSWLSSTTHQGIDVCTLGSSWRKNPEWLAENFAALDELDEPLVLLNRALAREGALVHVPKNTAADKPIQIFYFTTADEPLFAQVRNIVVVESGARVEIVERHQALNGKAHWTNAVTEIRVAPNAHVRYTKLQNDLSTATLTDATFVHQAADSTAVVNTFSFGGKLTRNDLRFHLAGSNAEAHLHGLTLINGDEHVDHRTFVDHAVPHCTSREVYKGVYDGRSHGVFNGQIMVRPQAQKTLAFQQNDNLLLNDRAQIDTKPQLEIFADDVKCSHGCTVGQLDTDALFYLRARGIPETEARALLMLAFANDALAQVELPALERKLHALIHKKLGVSVA